MAMSKLVRCGETIAVVDGQGNLLDTLSAASTEVLEAMEKMSIEDQHRMQAVVRALRNGSVGDDEMIAVATTGAFRLFADSLVKNQHP